ncbi:MAG: hypothetical protein K8F91_18925, partial [Candidatus Obscuribacterales bacterium]|nr:hypothetical protein [Candidatus Obscuribacterales bacterium]
LFPMLIIPLTGQFTYILIAESFAPIFECFLFWLVYYKFKGADKSGLLRDMSTIVIANFFSYGMGLVLESFGITF